MDGATTATRSTGISRVVRIVGGQIALADKLNALGKQPVTQQAVSLWVRQGFVPVKRIRDVCRCVDNRVSPIDLIDPEIRSLLADLGVASFAAAPQQFLEVQP